MGKRSSLIIILAIFSILYFFVYFRLTNFVFFNFDMPSQALDVQEFIKRGTFLTAQYFSEESVWQNISWGPSAVFFYAFFLKISSDPLIVSYLLSLLNLVSIGFVVMLVSRHFSQRAAVIAGFLLAFNPYWLTYARIIYVPSPMTFFIPFSMFLFFESVYKKKMWATILLFVSWTMLIQIYLPTYSFILTSLIALLFFIKSIKIRYLVIGAVLSLVVLLPTVNFYVKKPQYIQRIVNAPSLFTPKENTFFERLENVSLAYIQIPVGGRFDLQTGYGYSDFIKKYFPIYPYISPILVTVFVISLLWNLYKGLFKKDYRRLIILFWSIAPLWSMVVLWVSDILPRYYLLAFPAALVLVALTLNDFIAHSKLLWIVPITIVFYWIVFDLSYNSFIRNYDYPNGRLGDVAATSYIDFKKAIGWVISDAKTRECSLIISNNPKKPNFDIWLETRYVWMYVFQRVPESSSVVENPCYYIINYRSKPKELGITNFRAFGEFTAFSFKPFDN